MLFDITIPEIPIIITLEPQNSAYVYSGHCSENRTLFPSILSKIRIYSRQKSPENEKYPTLAREMGNANQIGTRQLGENS